jgi:hypothetical protein
MDFRGMRVKVQTGFNWLRIRSYHDPGEQDDEPSESIKTGTR